MRVLRVPAPDDARGNLHVGARPCRRASPSATGRSSPRWARSCARRGHFFVGLDVIGGYLTEINVTSPTGIMEANVLYDTQYEMRVIEALERKIG